MTNSESRGRAGGRPATRSRPGRLRGRQAEARVNDQRLLDAAREVFLSQGPDAPVSAVARRAGLGIGSLYRRYGSKADLLQRLLGLSLAQSEAAAEAALAADLDAWSALTGFIRRCVKLRIGVLDAVLGTVSPTPELVARAGRIGHLVQALVERAQAAGSVRPEAGASDIGELVRLFSRQAARNELLGRQRPELSDALRDAHERLLALTLDGMRTGAGEPLPGNRTSWEQYMAPWTRSARAK